MSIVVVQNQDIKFIQNQESKPEDPLFQLEYRNELFERLNISFHKEKKKMLDNFVDFVHKKKQTNILILERNFEYLVYSSLDLSESESQLDEKQKEEKNQQTEIIIEEKKEKLKKVTEVDDINLLLSSLPNLKINYFTLACVLIIQNMEEEIEYLMGSKQLKKFNEDVIKVFQKIKLPGCETLEQINRFLDKNTLVYEQLPKWNQTEIDSLFSEISKVGKKYFGNTIFVDICVDNLKKLPEYNEPEFMNCCLQFVLIAKL